MRILHSLYVPAVLKAIPMMEIQLNAFRSLVLSKGPIRSQTQMVYATIVEMAVLVALIQKIVYNAMQTPLYSKMVNVHNAKMGTSIMLLEKTVNVFIFIIYSSFIECI
jgi:hypothetical protein